MSKCKKKPRWVKKQLSGFTQWVPVDGHPGTCPKCGKSLEITFPTFGGKTFKVGQNGNLIFVSEDTSDTDWDCAQYTCTNDNCDFEYGAD